MLVSGVQQTDSVMHIYIVTIVITTDGLWQFQNRENIKMLENCQFARLGWCEDLA